MPSGCKNCLFSFAVSLKSDLWISCLQEAMEGKKYYSSQNNDVIFHIFVYIKVYGYRWKPGIAIIAWRMT